MHHGSPPPDRASRPRLLWPAVEAADEEAERAGNLWQQLPAPPSSSAVIADEQQEEEEGDDDHGALPTQRRQPVSQNGELLSRRGRASPASAGGVDTHRDSTRSRSDCSARWPAGGARLPGA
eukprot:COSAG01_NODE_10358_length_2184_cov_9.939118_3_plen_122_part_00